MCLVWWSPETEMKGIDVASKTDTAFNKTLKWTFIVLAGTAFFYSNLFPMFLTSFAVITAMVLTAFCVTWLISGDRPRWFAKKKKEKS